MCYAARPLALKGVSRRTNAKKAMLTEGEGGKIIICATFLIFTNSLSSMHYIYSLNKKIKFYLSNGGFPKRKSYIVYKLLSL